MSRLSHLSHLSPTFPQVWIEPVDNPVHNLLFSGEFSPICVPQAVECVPYPHPWTSCGQLSGNREAPAMSWGELTSGMWTRWANAEVVHITGGSIPRSSPGSVDDPTLAHRGNRPSSPVSTGPTTTTTSLTIDGIKSHKVMQQSSPRRTALKSKGEAQ